MASSLGFYNLCSFPLHKHKFPLVIRSQRFMDEQGKWGDMVDGNLSVLRKRIDEVKKKEEEKLMMTNGWEYQRRSDVKENRRSRCLMTESMEMVGLVSGAVGFVFLSGSLCICLVSIIVNLTIRS